MTARPRMPELRRAIVPVRLAIVLLLARLVTEPGGAEAFARPPYPVIFVHGIASDASTWLAVAEFLVAQGWMFGGVPTFVPASSAVTGVAAGDFYALNFSDYNAGIFHSQTLSLDRQGYELAAILQAVLAANPGAGKVILVAHSMGGLAAREYLQGLARIDPSAASIPYRGDVAQLIVIGTPHLGTPLASACQTLPAVCLAAAISPTSVAVTQLVPGGPALAALNDLAASPLPGNVRYESVAGLGGVGIISDGDGIVPRASEEFLAGVAGLDHRLQELTIPKRDDCGEVVVAGNSVVFEEVHTCEPGNPGVLSTALDAILQPRLMLTLNKETLSTGDTLTLTLGVQTGFPAQENTGDLYIGLLAPGGSLYLLTPAGLLLAFDGSAVIPAGVQPYRANTLLQDGTETIISGRIDAPIPPGQYTFVAVLVKPGMTITDIANWLSNVAVASFTAPASGSAQALSLRQNTLCHRLLGGQCLSLAAYVTVTGADTGRPPPEDA
jgi:pimeloyl-ACP methyl ester carboxylesterase